MAKLNLTQAAQAAGIARGTLYRHIKGGKVACEENGNGERVIDTSELLRVYKTLNSSETFQEDVQPAEIEQHKTPRDVPLLQQEAGFLRQRVAELEQDRAERKEREKSLQDTISKQQDTISRQQQALLPAPKKRGFFGLFGR